MKAPSALFIPVSDLQAQGELTLTASLSISAPNAAHGGTQGCLCECERAYSAQGPRGT